MTCAGCNGDTNSRTYLPLNDNRIPTELWGAGLCNECYLDIHPEAVLSHACVECGTRTRVGQWIDEDELKEWGLCQTCNFWIERLTVEPPNFMRVVTEDAAGRWHFMIGEEPELRNRWCGFGGAEMVISFFDGDVVVSHNLWAQGRIPDHLADRFTPNATIVGVAHGGSATRRAS